jgi:hypothetical protein
VRYGDREGRERELGYDRKERFQRDKRKLVGESTAAINPEFYKYFNKLSRHN